MVQFSHPHMTTGKTIALTRQTFVGKVMSLLFDMLSRLVKAFILRSKLLLISWLQSPSAVILEPPKNKVSVSIVSPSICLEVIGPDAMIFVFWMVSFKPAFSLSSFTHIKVKSWLKLKGLWEMNICENAMQAVNVRHLKDTSMERVTTDILGALPLPS